MSNILWVVFPYLCLGISVVGHFWRYKYDKFGWTTPSSQLYETRLLRWGSPMFHFGMLGVVMGHVVGLLIPKSWTEAVGITQEIYHTLAVGVGGIAGVMTVAGLAILIYRRRTVGPVFSATTKMDKVMYAVLAVVILLGMWNTLYTSMFSHYDYRDGVSLWFRDIFWLQPSAHFMVEAPVGFQAHALLAFVLFALWPFTRLVHVFSAPVGYLTRPYVVYRSRDQKTLRGIGNSGQRRGWEHSG